MAEYDISRLKVLVLEKHAHMRRIMCDILRQLGVVMVRDAADPSEAFGAFQEFPADIVLSDWSPGLDGITFLNLIRRHQKSHNVYVPVVMVTAYSDLHHICTARDAGMTEFLAKPISARLIYARIKSIIDNPRSFIRNMDYFGPDRRRRRLDFGGQDRRNYVKGSSDRRTRQLPVPHGDRRTKHYAERAAARM